MNRIQRNWWHFDMMRASEAMENAIEPASVEEPTTHYKAEIDDDGLAKFVTQHPHTCWRCGETYYSRLLKDHEDSYWNQCERCKHNSPRGPYLPEIPE